MNIFNHSMEKFSTFKFLPITDEESIGAMGEKWEMVYSQKNRLSIWAFAGEKTEWFCLDFFVGDEYDSFEMAGFVDTKWEHTQTLWLRTLDEVIEFVGVLARLDIDQSM